MAQNATFNLIFLGLGRSSVSWHYLYVLQPNIIMVNRNTLLSMSSCQNCCMVVPWRQHSWLNGEGVLAFGRWILVTCGGVHSVGIGERSVTSLCVDLIDDACLTSSMNWLMAWLVNYSCWVGGGRSLPLARCIDGLIGWSVRWWLDRWMLHAIVQGMVTWLVNGWLDWVVFQFEVLAWLMTWSMVGGLIGDVID